MKIFKTESAEGSIPADAWIQAIIKVACILVIGIVIMGAAVSSANISVDSSMYSLLNDVQSTISSGYMLAGLMVIVLGAAALLHFLGFM